MQIDGASEAAFWAKVEVGDSAACWPWTGARNTKGYGNVRVNCSYWKAHRLAWTLCNFEIPAGFVVCHSCDNPSCCNPGHLMIGRPMANFIDMVTKRRGEFRKNKAIGERNTNSKVTADQVLEIRQTYSAGQANQYELADRYGITQTAIGCILRRKTWRHV